MTIAQVFFLHPTIFVRRGGGLNGLTGVEPREDLGDVLIDGTSHKTYILKSSLVIKIPSKSSSSFILKYSFLNPNHEYYKDWNFYREKMILGIRYMAPYSTTYPVQETYAPLYKTTKQEFDRTLADLFKAIDEEWKRFCCPLAICDCN